MPIGIVLDNGGGFVKAAKVTLNSESNGGEVKRPSEGSSPEGSSTFVSPAQPKALIVPNALAKAGKNALPIPPGSLGKSRRPRGFLAAAEIDKAPDFSGMTFRRSIDRGVVTLWDAQRDVWASVFSADFGVDVDDPSDASLLVTEPLALPLHMRFAMDELVFEEFGFGEYSPVPPQRLAAASMERHTALVLDSGFSFTHAVPVVEGVEIASKARRLNLGGKALTNHLKEIVSYRSWNMMDETAVMNAVKERLCFASMSYCNELDQTKRRENSILRKYVLPDLSRGGVDPYGHILQDGEELDGTEQVLVMNNERICVPEVLFNPSDLGIRQAGVAELIFQAVDACPEELHAELYANVILTGGNCRFPNFRDRVMSELRPLVNDIYDLNVIMDEDPMLTSLNGGVRVFTENALPLKMVSKAQYDESGSEGILRELYKDRDAS